MTDTSRPLNSEPCTDRWLSMVAESRSIGPCAVRVAGALYSRQMQPNLRLGTRVLRELAGIGSMQTLFKALKQLEKAGFVAIKRGDPSTSTTNKYTLTYPGASKSGAGRGDRVNNAGASSMRPMSDAELDAMDAQISRLRRIEGEEDLVVVLEALMAEIRRLRSGSHVWADPQDVNGRHSFFVSHDPSSPKDRAYSMSPLEDTAVRPLPF